ncbi:hypothetical protein B9K02_12170, partial [Lentilactobacillus kefiri]
DYVLFDSWYSSPKMFYELNMYYKFLVNIHDKISSNFKGLAKHDPNKWQHFISVNEMLDQLEESVVEIEFE